MKSLKKKRQTYPDSLLYNRQLTQLSQYRTQSTRTAKISGDEQTQTQKIIFINQVITVQEAVVFEASPAEESVEGVQRLLPLHRLGKGSVQVGCAEWGQLHWAGGLEEVLIPVEVTGKVFSRQAKLSMFPQT